MYNTLFVQHMNVQHLECTTYECTTTWIYNTLNIQHLECTTLEYTTLECTTLEYTTYKLGDKWVPQIYPRVPLLYFVLIFKGLGITWPGVPLNCLFFFFYCCPQDIYYTWGDNRIKTRGSQSGMFRWTPEPHVIFYCCPQDIYYTWGDNRKKHAVHINTWTYRGVL